jgi:murein DD-endopeptidase MepM/ murein hydrolase activator NlpD
MNASRKTQGLTLLLLLLVAGRAIADVTGGSGGGPIAQPQGDCIPRAQREAVAAEIARNRRPDQPLPPGGPVSYPFQPIAGTVWQDRFILNFVDLDPTAGILDWDCTDFTYDGHRGHDIDLRFFGEQDVGVPIFAALDGSVIAAHDGEFDRNTSLNASAVANYVILDHGSGHHSLYWHMRSNSVAVTVGQIVKAGTQLGLAASSGYSTGPHLHFESQLSGTAYEPYAGTCQTATPGRWVSQIPIRRDTYLAMFEMHGTNNMTPFLPENPPRKGTFVRTGTFQPIGVWYIVHNQPAGSTWRARYLRPNSTVFFDSGPQNYNNSTSYRWAQWWMYYNLNPDIAGQWTLEFSVNGTVLANAPFTVLNSGGVPTNRRPNSVTAAFDPVSPGTNDAVFCRLSFPLLDDPDYDLVRYRYQWKLNGAIVRDRTNAAVADAVPRALAQTGDFLSCTITPLDGVTNGQSVTVSTFVGGAVRPWLEVTRLGEAGFRLSWAASGPPYTLELATNLITPIWQPLTNGISQSGGQNIITNPGNGNPRLFRLRFPY